MPLGVQARCGTSRTILGALTATAAALRAEVEAAMPSGFVHHGRVFNRCQALSSAGIRCPPLLGDRGGPLCVARRCGHRGQQRQRPTSLLQMDSTEAGLNDWSQKNPSGAQVARGPRIGSLGHGDAERGPVPEAWVAPRPRPPGLRQGRRPTVSLRFVVRSRWGWQPLGVTLVLRMKRPEGAERQGGLR